MIKKAIKFLKNIILDAGIMTIIVLLVLSMIITIYR